MTTTFIFDKEDYIVLLDSYVNNKSLDEGYNPLTESDFKYLLLWYLGDKSIGISDNERIELTRLLTNESNVNDVLELLRS